MAAAMVGEGTNYENLTYTVGLNSEEYGVGFRLGSDVAEALNAFLLASYKDGSLMATAETYGVQAALINQIVANDADAQYVINKGTLVVGITDFAPMDYKNENGEWIGFDADVAKAFADSLGVAVEFVEIDWNTKEAKLNDETLDLVWNGMTITEQRSAEMQISVPYLLNKQVAVVLKEDASKYNSSKMSMAQAIMTAEAGSAGETVIIGEQDAE
jgi:polar amino acid transport system substrate-binding protein